MKFHIQDTADTQEPIALVHKRVTHYLINRFAIALQETAMPVWITRENHKDRATSFFYYCKFRFIYKLFNYAVVQYARYNPIFPLYYYLVCCLLAGSRTYGRYLYSMIIYLRKNHHIFHKSTSSCRWPTCGLSAFKDSFLP